MGFIFPERQDGPRTTPLALVGFAAAEDCLSAARDGLTAAHQVDWVSAAADSYQRLLTDATGDLLRLGVALGSARPVVLRHTRASDVAREAEEIERAAGRLVLPQWAGYGTPSGSPLPIPLVP